MKHLKKLTPLIILQFFTLPYAGDTINFPYTLSWKTDIPLVSTTVLLGVFAHAAYNIQPNPISSDIIGLHSSDVNAFDRTATDNWSESADLGSDILLGITRYSPFLMNIPLLSKRQWYQTATLTTMYAEALVISGCLVSITKSLTNRPRPYMYGSEFTVEQKVKKGKGAFRSFYSGHTSGAFCSAVFISKVFCDMYPSSRFKGFMWGISMSAATTTGILRYTAGKHFPTDIITGACMGSLVGYCIPVLHKEKDTAKVSVYQVWGDYTGIIVSFRF
jgi:membrane-associated phospholipid phosphatase